MSDSARTGDLQPLSGFASNLSWSSWAFDRLVKRPATWGFDLLVKRPIAWTTQKVFGSSQSDDPGEEMVLVHLVKVLKLTIKETNHSQSINAYFIYAIY